MKWSLVTIICLVAVLSSSFVYAQTQINPGPGGSGGGDSCSDCIPPSLIGIDNPFQIGDLVIDAPEFHQKVETQTFEAGQQIDVTLRVIENTGASSLESVSLHAIDELAIQGGHINMQEEMFSIQWRPDSIDIIDDLSILQNVSVISQTVEFNEDNQEHQMIIFSFELTEPIHPSTIKIQMVDTRRNQATNYFEDVIAVIPIPLQEEPDCVDTDHRFEQYTRRTTITEDQFYQYGSDFTVKILKGTIVTGAQCWTDKMMPYAEFDEIQGKFIGEDPNIANTLDEILWTDQQDNVTRTITSVYKLGSDDFSFTFNKPVELVFEGKAGQRVGFAEDAKSPIKPTAECFTYDDLVGEGVFNLNTQRDCIRNNTGSNLIVQTFHFTHVFTYTETGSSPSPGPSTSTASASSSTPQEPIAPEPPLEPVTPTTPQAEVTSPKAIPYQQSLLATKPTIQNPNTSEEKEVPSNSDIPDVPADPRILTAGFALMVSFLTFVPGVFDRFHRILLDILRLVGYSATSAKSAIVYAWYRDSMLFEKTEISFALAFLALAVGSILHYFEYEIPAYFLYAAFFGLLAYHHLMWFVYYSYKFVPRPVHHLLIFLGVLGLLGYLYLIFTDTIAFDLLQAIAVAGFLALAPLTVFVALSFWTSRMDVIWILVGSGLIAVMTGLVLLPSLSIDLSIVDPLLIHLVSALTLSGCGAMIAARYILSTKYARIPVMGSSS